MEDPAPSTSQPNHSTLFQREETNQLPMTQKMGKKIRSRKAKDQPNLLLESVLHSLRTCSDGNELQALVSALASPARVVEKEFNSLKTDLMGVLKFPDNQPSIYEFGSIRSGLLFRDSDLDFYISFAKGKIEREEQIKLIHTVCGRMIRKGTFKDITKIWRAKLPLLRAVHVVTNRQCDINFSNDRGWYNSMLLRAVMRFDPRIHQLAVIIKFWARCAHIFTVQKQMNSYCLVMMLIFFLQTHELPVLPSVEDMQQGIPRINDGAWNFAYPVQIEYKTWNVNTVRELLVSFFKFYAEFDFGKNLISPFVGRLCSLQELEKKTIRELATYYRAVEREDYPELSCGPFLTIQDPFELNVNVGKVLRMKMLYEQLTVSFRHAYDVCQAHQGKKFSDLLIALFTDTKRHQKTKGKNKNKTNYFHPNFIDTNVHQETKGQNKIKPNNFHPNFTDTKRHQKTKGQNKIKPNNFHPNFIDRSRYRIIDALCILRDLPMIVWVYCFIFLFSVGTFWFVEWVVDIFVANPKYWLIFPLLCIFIRPQNSTASINGLCFMLSILLIIATIGKMLAANYVISIYGL